MSHSTAEARALAPRAAATTRDFPWPLLLAVVAFGFLWWEIISQLSSEWSLNPQYGYGWTVPFLALVLFWQRWSRRPDVAAPKFSGLTIALFLLAALALFPARLIAVANPDWRMLDWIMALAVVTISLGALQLAGGFPTLQHFAFPVLFFLVAVPWPVQIEQFVVQHLMRADAAITIGILNVIGTLAVQHGNVIELPTGQVGIDDACTGVRSLQATFMIALFLGAFYRMNLRRRFLLIVIAAGLAFVCNIGRTFLLCEIAASNGLEAIHRWHDPAGFTILFICVFALWGVSLWLQAPLLPNDQKKSEGWLLPNPGWSLALLVWLGLTEIAVAAWYAPRHHELSAAWSIAWPTSEQGYETQPIPAAAAELLRYNEGGAALWRSADERRWMMYSFHWLPGRTAALFVKNHRPDICLPASGLTMQHESGVHVVRANGIDLPIRAYRFDNNGQPLHIFYCYWDGRSSYTDAAAATEDWTARGRLHSAWQGKRELGARMFELAVWGHENDAEAETALQRELEKVVLRE
ncbi:MAG: exosortase/archaeosortase family protein [Chthoniobacterales bacterium]|nr:exosortase/archaeosortase family protein [Chthoniobacterales bacterium]